MSRMTRSRRKQLYDLLALRDGPYCFVGGEEGNEQTLVVDRWDTDPKNDDPSNFRLLCPWSERIKNSLGGKRRSAGALSNYCVCENTVVNVSEVPPTTSLEFLKNLKAEPAFRHWLFEEVVRREQVPFGEVLDSGAVAARCSQATVRRYLAKELSPMRLYHVVQAGEEKFVRLKPEWERFRKVIADQRLLDKQARNWRKDLLDGLPVTMNKPKSETNQASNKKNSAKGDPGAKGSIQ